MDVLVHYDGTKFLRFHYCVCSSTAAVSTARQPGAAVPLQNSANSLGRPSLRLDDLLLPIFGDDLYEGAPATREDLHICP